MTKTSANECLFCTNRGKLSKEHIFGDALNRALNTGSTHARHEVSVGGQWSKGRLWREGGVLGSTLKCVCRDRKYEDGRPLTKGCNNTWMSRIQEEAKPLLLQFNESGLRQLEEENALKIALWVTTAVMVIDAAHPPTQVIPRHIRHSYGSAGGDRRPPKDWQIFAAPYDGGRASDFFWHRAFVLPDRKTGIPPDVVADSDRAHLTTFAVGTVVFHAFSHQSERVNLHPSAYAAPFGLQTIWPINGLPRNVRFTTSDIEKLMVSGPNFVGAL